MYTDTPSHQSNSAGEIIGAVRGWSKYAGLGSALDECCETTPENVLIWLGRFLDEWESAVEMEEDELVHLFDTVDADASFDTTMDEQNSDTAGDAAVHYIELLSQEKQRLKEVEKVFASLLEKCDASAENLCWRHWMQEISPHSPKFLEWDRSGGERAGRDVYSHFGTCWFAPQFPKFVPEYLDHSIQPKIMDVQKQPTLTPDDIAEFNLGGEVEIVDITKRIVSGGDQPEGSEEEDEDDGSLGFPGLKEKDEDVEEPKCDKSNKTFNNTNNTNNNAMTNKPKQHNLSSP